MKRIKKIICVMLASLMIFTGLSPMQMESVSAKTKKNGINKTQITMYQGETFKLSVTGTKNAKWKSSSVKIASVSKNGIVTAKKNGKVKITAKAGKKTYTCRVTVKKKPAVTRGQWIVALLKQTGTKTTSVSSYHFSDTKKYSGGKAIETAYCRNIIPVKKGTKNFYPNRPATREFMAVTAVRAMGFKADTSEKLKCSDKGKLKYASEDKVAINQKIISLKKGKFMPSNAITLSEKKKALAAIRNIQKAEQVNPSHKDTVNYQTEVVKQPLKSENDYSVSASGSNLIITIQKNNNTQKIQKGKVIVLPQKTGSHDQIALKVRGVSEDGNGNYHIVGETPDISELYKKVDVQDSVKTDMTNFEENSDVVSSVDTSVSSNNRGLRFGSSKKTFSTNAREVTTLQLKETNLGSTGSVKGSVEISAPKVSAIVDADFSNPLKPVYNQVTVTLEEDVKAQATLKFSSKGKGAGKIYLGHVTASLGYGLFADVLCYLNISAEGEATVQYTLANEVCASYINGNFRMDANSKGSWQGTKVEVNGQVLGEPQINLRAMGFWFDDKLYGAIQVVGVKADFGPKFKASVKVHDTKPKRCTSLSIYAYLSVGLNTDSGLGEFLKKHTKLKLSKTIWDDNASNPLRAAWHYEDGERTKGDVCTYKKDENDKTSTISSYKIIKLFEDQVSSVGGVTFFSKKDDDSRKTTIYYKVNNKTKVLESGQGLGIDIITNGRYVYYYVEVKEDTYNCYKKDIKTGSKKVIFSQIAECITLSGLYNNKLYYVIGYDPGIFYSYDMKTRKKTKVMYNVTAAVQYGSIFLCTPYGGDYSPSILRIYDAKNNIKKTITKNALSCRMISNSFYYVDYVRAYDSDLEYETPEDCICNVIKCDLNGDNKQILLKNEPIHGFISEITSSYIQYTHYDYDNDTQEVYTIKFNQN